MTTELSKIDSIMKNPKELDALKQICAKDSNESEFTLLLEMCKAMNLNPFLKEIYQLKIGGRAQTFISRDGYRVISQRQKNYDYHFVGAIYSNDIFKVVNGLINHEYGNSARGELLGAYCVVKKHDSTREVSTVVKLSEFNKGQSNWLTMPEVMITKVAEASALRMAFASEFVGTYHESEQWEEKPKQVSKVTPKPVIDVKPEPEKKITKISTPQIASILSMIAEVELPKDRKDKALKYYDVSSIEQLNMEDADHFLQMLNNIKLERRQAEIDEELK